MLEGWNVEQNEKCWNINKKNFVARSLLGGNVALGGSLSLLLCMCSNVRRLSPSMSKIIFQAHTRTCSIVLHWLTYNSCIIYLFIFSSSRDLKSARTLKRKTRKLQNVVSKQCELLPLVSGTHKRNTPNIVRKPHTQHTHQLHNMVVCEMEFRFLSCAFFGNRSWKCSNFKRNRKNLKKRKEISPCCVCVRSKKTFLRIFIFFTRVLWFLRVCVQVSFYMECSTILTLAQFNKFAPCFHTQEKTCK